MSRKDPPVPISAALRALRERKGLTRPSPDTSDEQPFTLYKTSLERVACLKGDGWKGSARVTRTSKVF